MREDYVKISEDIRYMFDASDLFEVRRLYKQVAGRLSELYFKKEDELVKRHMEACRACGHEEAHSCCKDEDVPFAIE